MDKHVQLDFTDNLFDAKKTRRNIFLRMRLRYRALTYFDPPLTYFDPPIISSISNEFALSEKYVEFWCTNLQLTAESSHYLMWLKSLCSWIKERQRWIKVRQSTVQYKKAHLYVTNHRGVYGQQPIEK